MPMADPPESTETVRLRRRQDLTASLSRAASVEEVARALVERAVEATGAAAASVSVVTNDHTALNILASIGYESMSHENWDHWPIDVDHPLGEAARSGEPRWTESRAELLADHPSMALTPGVPEFGAFAALPLLSGGRTVGVIGLSFERDRPFSTSEREDLLAMTNLVAVAVERALLYEEAARSAAEARRANERLRFLGDATQLLASSLDYDDTVRTLARLCVPTFADWVSVDLLEPDGQIRQLIVVHQDPSRLQYANEIRSRYPLNLDEPTGVAKVIRTGRSEFHPEISEAMLEAASEPQREIARTIELSSVIIVPLEVRGTMLGAMTLLYGESGRHYDELDLRMAESLGRRAAIAIDNATVYQDRDEMARTLQRNLLPPALPRIPRADVATRYEPFGLQHEVGGDFYDVFPAAEGGWGMLIGDVCGKGAGAAAVMGVARFTLRALALREADPAALFQGLNEALLQQHTDGRFCTATYAWIRPAVSGFTAIVSVAGHPPALILRGAGTVEEVGPTGALLGIFEDPAIGTTEIHLAPGDALLLYTDGAVGRGSVTGARLAPVRDAADDADAIAETFLREAIERGHGELRDDIAVLVFKAA